MKMKEIVDINYFNFKQKYLVQDYRGTDGQPVHTRYLKNKFYRFAKQLKDEFGFDMFTCSSTIFLSILAISFIIVYMFYCRES